jgi:hypothetical protein
MYFFDSLHILAVAGDLDFGASMLTTKNSGAMWEYRFLEIFGEPAALALRTPREAWCPLGFEGVFIMTQDTGRTWNSVAAPHRRPIYDAVFTDSLTGYAVGDSGMILKYSVATHVQAEHPDKLPTTFRLLQNFPNPFNPSTEIRFQMPEVGSQRSSAFGGSRVTLKVLDVLGREIETLVNDVRRPGEHRVVWNASSAASGIYFARLSAGPFVEVMKMVLIR